MVKAVSPLPKEETTEIQKSLKRELHDTQQRTRRSKYSTTSPSSTTHGDEEDTEEDEEDEEEDDDLLSSTKTRDIPPNALRADEVNKYISKHPNVAEFTRVHWLHTSWLGVYPEGHSTKHKFVAHAKVQHILDLIDAKKGDDSESSDDDSSQQTFTAPTTTTTSNKTSKKSKKTEKPNPSPLIWENVAWILAHCTPKQIESFSKTTAKFRKKHDNNGEDE